MTTNHDDPAKHGRPAASAAERDLDRMLDMLAPPAPSDTLRARLKRDFAPPGVAGAAAGGRRPLAAFEWRAGGMAVAAALVLAVGLGVLMPPAPSPRMAATAAMNGAVVDTVALDAASLAEEDAAGADSLAATLADSAPDSALFMVATFDASTGTTPAASSYGGDFAGLMPLE